MDVLIENDQHIRVSGSGTSRQNSLAEFGIQTVIQMAHTMMIHSAMRSPQCNITDEMWPMAIDHAVWLYNLIPHDDSGIYTYKLCSRYSFLPIKDILYTCPIWGDPITF